MVEISQEQQELNEKIGQALIEYVQKHEFGTCTTIYFNNKRIRFDDATEYTTTTNINVRDYLEYSNPQTVSMSYEGFMYNMFNYNEFPNALEELHKIIDSFGYYTEFGHAWNFSLYEK